jgi:O-antigen biosynthesis protein
MLDWTGERFLPWAKEATVAYEHLHRYIWASNLVRGKRVLDLASGEGYGANMLALQAAFVCGVDIDPQAVQHAGRRYRRSNLQFLQGDITAVPISERASFDVIVCFEAIEHIAEHDRLIGEVVRLLKPNGVFIVSTPNKDVYKAGPEEVNPFHVKELTFAEFDALLSSHFPNVQYLGQRVHPGSTLWPLGSKAPVQEFAIAKVGDEYQSVAHDQRVAEYYVAVASHGGMAPVEGSVVFDHSDELIREKDRELAALRQQVEQRDEALEWRADQVEVLEREKTELTFGIEAIRKDLESSRGELEAVHASRAWKVVVALRRLRDRFR